jgi:hypothetical protein
MPSDTIHEVIKTLKKELRELDQAIQMIEAIAAGKRPRGRRPAAAAALVERLTARRSSKRKRR